jgi:hypothetical protein
LADTDETVADSGADLLGNDDRRDGEAYWLDASF